MNCIYDEATLWDWVAGDLPAEQAARVQAHVQTCEVCQANIAQIRGIHQGFVGLPDRVRTPLTRMRALLWIPAAISGAYALLLAALVPLMIWVYFQGPAPTLIKMKTLWTGVEVGTRLLLPSLIPSAILSLAMLSLLGLWSLRMAEARR